MHAPADGGSPPSPHRSAQAKRPSLIIVSAMRFLRETLDEILRRDHMFEVCASCAALREAVASCHATQPDLILLDAAFPQGPRAVGPLRDAAPQARVVAMAVTENEESVIPWAEAGAAGYVSSDAALGDLVALLIEILQGRQACSGAVAAGLLRRLAGTSPPTPSPLTVRERQIVRLIGAGMSNKDIARQLNIGVATTKSHVHNVLSKLNIQRRAQAVGWMRDTTI